MKRNELFSFKHKEQGPDLKYISPKLMIVFGYFCSYAIRHKLPVVITNVLEKFSVSTSNTHPEGRALDISVKNWSEEDIETVQKYMQATVEEDFGAISAKTLKPNVIVYHNAGLGPHFHIQVSR